MRRVLIESPFGTTVEGCRASPQQIQVNMAYAKACMLDCFKRGEAPFASHVTYPAVLADSNPAERAQGIEAGLTWGDAGAELTAVYVDLGITSGMRQGIERAKRSGRPVEERRIDIATWLHANSLPTGNCDPNCTHDGGGRPRIDLASLVGVPRRG